MGPKHAPGVIGRNNDKYTFDGIKGLAKGRFVLAVIRKHAASNKKLSISKLQDIFDPDKTIQPRFSVLAEISAAKQFSKNGKDRFLLNPDDVFVTGDGKKAVVCSQWTAENMKPLCAIFKQLGYKFKTE